MLISDKYVAECLACNLTYVGKSDRKDYSVVKCMTCGTVGEYAQYNIRAGRVRCGACHETKMIDECLEHGFEWIRKVDGHNSLCRCLTCGHEDIYQQSNMCNGNVKCTSCYETRMKKECLDQGFEWIHKVNKRKSLCRCLTCGHVDAYEQGNMRSGSVKCTSCYETRMKNECLDQGFEWVRKVDKTNSLCRCLACGHQDTYSQDAMRRGEVRCSTCYETRMKNECLREGFEWIRKDDGKKSLCRCLACGHQDTYSQDAMRNGKVKCNQCQITKYQQVAKRDWEFINHFRDGRNTFVNLKHTCGDDLVKVHVSHFLKGSYDCPHCMHTHFSDQSFFYVIEVQNIIKLGISNRPDQRYTQYGLPDDVTIIEHLRIPLESKRDALVVESYAKQLVKEFKLIVDNAKKIFTKEGFNECYTIDALEHLLTI